MHLEFLPPGKWSLAEHQKFRKIENAIIIMAETVNTLLVHNKHNMKINIQIFIKNIRKIMYLSFFTLSF